jgi:predicted KAP-like P-loop ATPase
LGFLDYAKVLSSTITSAETNLTIRIFGGWGTGKTTLMKPIQNELDQLPQRDIRSVWFNTWQYESKEYALWPLCESIGRQFEEKSPLDEAGENR